MKSLQEIWDDLATTGVKSDKGDIHSYLPVYEELLAPYREKVGNVLEIGLFNGDSFRMFKEYYGGNVRTYGIDCDWHPHGGMADLTPLMNTMKEVCILDAENEEQVRSRFGVMKFNVIIEDAGHHIEQQLKMYSIFKNYLAKNATYCIEDIQDIDATRGLFENIDPEKEVTILDRRHIKNRYDDVLVIIKDKT